MKKVIASILTIVLSIPLFVSTPLAEAHGPNNIIETPYGTCTYEFYYDNANTHDVTIGGVTIPGTGPIHLIRYTFTHPYTGTFDVDLNNNSILNNIWNLLTSNCYLMSVADTDTLRFAVNNATYCEIAITPSQYYQKLFISLKNQNLTPIEDTTTAVNTIMTTTNYMSGQIQTMSANTTTIRNVLLESLGGYTSADENVHTDLTNLLTAFNTVGNDISDILTAVSSIDTNLATLTSTQTQSYALLNNIKSYLLNAIGDYSSNTSVHTDLLAIVNAVNQYGTNIESLITAINNINNKLSVIDNTLDTITWTKIKNMYVTNDFSSFINTSGSYNNTYYVSSENFYVPDYTNLNQLIHIHCNVHLNPIRNYKLYYRNNTGSSIVDISNYIIYEERTRYFIDIYFKINMDSNTLGVNSNGYIYLEFTGTFSYYENNTNNYIEYIGNKDIEYWQLLTYFSANKYQIETKSLLQQIINAIKGINVTQNTTENNINQSINNYNTNINPVYNVENNYGTQLDTQLQNYNPDNTTIISRLSASGNIMATVLNGINGIELFTVPISVMLVGIVLLAIVG